MGALDIPGFHADGCSLFRCDYATLAAHMREAGIVADALIVDAPYSERTHKGHDGATGDGFGTWTRSNGRVEKKIARREIDYLHWTTEDVCAFVEAWAPLVTGWICSLTDDLLFQSWRAIMGETRQTFQSVACVERGMTVRLTGDGPSSWCTHLAAARPRSRKMAKWGTLPGAYVGPSERKDVTGGKPLWLMRALVRDYSRPGDLVCDPCAGGGTTLVAALEEGRRAIGCEPDAGRYEIAVRRIREARRPLPRMAAVKSEQLGLGGE